MRMIEWTRRKQPESKRGRVQRCEEDARSSLGGVMRGLGTCKILQPSSDDPPSHRCHWLPCPKLGS